MPRIPSADHLGKSSRRVPKSGFRRAILVTSKNRKWCRQTGSRQSTPLSTIRTRYGNSVSTPEATRTGKSQQNSLQREADTGFQYRPHIVNTDIDCGRHFCGRHFRDSYREVLLFGTSCPPPPLALHSSNLGITLHSGFSKLRFCTLGNLCFAPWIPVVFVISVLSVISANPAINPLACGCLSCLRRFRDFRCFREKRRIAKHRFGKT